MKRTFPRARWVALASIVAISFLSGGWLLRPRRRAGGGRLPAGPPVRARRRRHPPALHRLARRRRPLPARRHRPGGSLDDPYAELLVNESYREYRRQMTGTEVDFGCRGAHRVRAGVAAAAGFRPGDEVLSIDGRSTRGWSPRKVEEALRGGSRRRPSPSSCGRAGRPAGRAPADPHRGACPRRLVRRTARRPGRLRRAPPHERGRGARSSGRRSTG